MSRTGSWYLIDLGNQSALRGDYRSAIARFEEAVARARAEGDTASEVDALKSIVLAYGNMGDNREWVRAATRLLARARQLHDEESTMWAGLRLASALYRLDARGRWGEIRTLLLEGLEVARALGNTDAEQQHLQKLGAGAVAVGEFEEGMDWLQRALTHITPGMFEEHLARVNVYVWLSALMRRRGDWGEAVRYAEMALGEARIDGHPAWVAYAQVRLARAEAGRGERAEALRLVEEALPPARRLGWWDVEQAGEALRAQLERELGHPREAEEAARRALALAQETGLREEEVEALLEVGRALLAQGAARRREASEVLDEALRLSRERGYPDHSDTITQVLQELH